MQCLAPTRKATEDHGRILNPTLIAVAIFDGLFESINAMKAMECLADSLEPGCGLTRLAWSFDKLQRLDVRHLSIHQAAEADIVIIAAGGDHPLPDHVKSWLEAIRQELVRPLAALIVLHDEDRNQNRPLFPGPLCCELRGLACQWHCEFMWNAEFDERLNEGFAAQIVRRRFQQQSNEECGARFLIKASHWGINE